MCISLETRAAFDLLLLLADNAARPLDSGLTADDAIAAIEAGLDASLNGTDPEPTAPAPVAVAPVAAPIEGEAAPASLPTEGNREADRAARTLARRSVRVAPVSLSGAASPVVATAGTMGPHEIGSDGWREWSRAQVAHACAGLSAMLSAETTPHAVAAYVLSLGIVGGAVSRIIEDGAFPGTFAEAVFSILAD